MDQLLWLETLLKGTIGISLLLSPNFVIHIFALPSAASAFWPRLFGGLLIGLSAATFLTGARIIDDGIGLGALALINGVIACLLVPRFVIERRQPHKRRSKTVLGILILVTTIMAIAELLAR